MADDQTPPLAPPEQELIGPRGRFLPGNQFGRRKGSPKIGGRKKGTPNETTATMKESLIATAEEIGDGTGKGGKNAYLLQLAKTNPDLFAHHLLKATVAPAREGENENKGAATIMNVRCISVPTEHFLSLEQIAKVKRGESLFTDAELDAMPDVKFLEPTVALTAPNDNVIQLREPYLSTKQDDESREEYLASLPDDAARIKHLAKLLVEELKRLTGVDDVSSLIRGASDVDKLMQCIDLDELKRIAGDVDIAEFMRRVISEALEDVD